MRWLIVFCLLGTIVTFPSSVSSGEDSDASNASKDGASDTGEPSKDIFKDIPQLDPETIQSLRANPWTHWINWGGVATDFPGNGREVVSPDLKRDELLQSLIASDELTLAVPKLREDPEVLRRLRQVEKWNPGTEDGLPLSVEGAPRAAYEIKVPADIIHQVAENNPDSGYAQYELGRVQIEEGDENSAFESFDNAIKLGEVTPDSLVAHAGLANRLGMPDVARESARKALALDPKNEAAEAIFKLSRHAAPKLEIPKPRAQEKPDRRPPDRAGNATEVQALQREAQEAIWESDRLARKAEDLLKEKKHKEAESAAGEAVVENPDNAYAWNLRAMARFELADYERSFSDIQKSIELVPGNRVSLLLRARTLNRLERYQEAHRDARSLLARGEKDFRAHLVGAHALAGMGDRDGTLRSLSRAAQLNRRLKGLYERALRLPEEESLLALFDDSIAAGEQPASAGAPPSPAPVSKLPVYGIAGALALLLIAMGLWGAREKLATTSFGRIFSTSSASAGTRLGDTWYTIGRQIGQGGMGVVYEARDLALDRTVALKKIRDDLKNSPADCEQFLTEARMVARLKHPGIVEVYSIVDGEEDFYMVLEYIEGRNLSELLHDRGKLEFRQALEIVQAAAAAVDYAHAKGIIHRDIKPSNIMISAEGEVKVMDFGIAKAKESVESIAMTRHVAGTPLYMAPEQEQGAVCRQSDIFALGVCFYEMVAGRPPFAGQGGGLALNKAQGRFDRLSAVAGVAALSSDIDAVMARVLDPDPRKRFASAGEFAGALQGLPVA